MFAEFLKLVNDWIALDTWMVITGALAAMSCALPGAWLLLRRQSLLGDALSHSVLPGIVLAYLGSYWLESHHWMATDSGIRHLLLFLGAAISGVISAIATEFIQRWGRIDRSATLGIVFTTMFALGLLMIRMFADQVDVDPGCVLYGSLETSAMIPVSHQIDIPRAAVINGLILAVNGILVIVFFKELRLSTFDPGLASALGLNSNAIQLVLMVMTAATLVAAFESVGAILVIAMLIVPAATARMLTDRLPTMLVLSLIIAAASALFGHVAACTLPKLIFSRLGFSEVEDASTTGMMAVASGVLFVIAIFASPRHGVIRKMIDRLRLQIRIAGEDILGTLYRRDEIINDAPEGQISDSPNSHHRSSFIQWLAHRDLERRGLIAFKSPIENLTDKGRQLAKSLVRSHRLWEAYMARNFVLPDDHLHAIAEQVEHYLSPELQSDLAIELNEPVVDPHGKSIPQND